MNPPLSSARFVREEPPRPTHQLRPVGLHPEQFLADEGVGDIVFDERDELIRLVDLRIVDVAGVHLAGHSLIRLDSNDERPTVYLLIAASLYFGVHRDGDRRGVDIRYLHCEIQIGRNDKCAQTTAVPVDPFE